MSMVYVMTSGECCEKEKTQAQCDLGRCVEEIANLKSELQDLKLKHGLLHLELATEKQAAKDANTLMLFYRAVVEEVALDEEEE